MDKSTIKKQTLFDLKVIIKDLAASIAENDLSDPRYLASLNFRIKRADKLMDKLLPSIILTNFIED